MGLCNNNNNNNYYYYYYYYYCIFHVMETTWRDRLEREGGSVSVTFAISLFIPRLRLFLSNDFFVSMCEISKIGKPITFGPDQVRLPKQIWKQITTFKEFPFFKSLQQNFCTKWKKWNNVYKRYNCSIFSYRLSVLVMGEVSILFSGIDIF